MRDTFGWGAINALKVMGISLPVAAAIVFGLGAYQGCQVTSNELAARSTTLQWSEGHFSLCYAHRDAPLLLSPLRKQASRPCDTGVAILRGLDVSSSVQRGICESHGWKIAGLCTIYDWGRAITEPAPALDTTDRVFVDGLWRRAMAEIRTRCGDASDITESSFLIAGLHRIAAGTSTNAPLGRIVLRRIQEAQRCNFTETPTTCLQDMIELQNVTLRLVAERRASFPFLTFPPIIHCAPLPEPWADRSPTL